MGTLPGICDESIRRHALLRISRLFNVEAGSLPTDASFGKELRPSFVSDFKVNEFDRLDNDIKDVADREILKELRSGVLTIRTVRDYCEHMVRCYRTRPDEVIHVLQITHVDQV
ncbi:MAG: hypothetical protein AB7O90_19615 [Hyphomicrobium sp.]